MDTRLSIAMTLVLAINVFQVVLVENTPETGYLPLLALYTLLNTILLVMHCAHSILMAQAHKCYRHRKTLKGYEKELVNDSTAIRFIVRIQRAFRRARNRAEWRARRRERYERSLEARLRRWWAAPVPSRGGAHEAEGTMLTTPHGDKPVPPACERSAFRQLTTLRQLAGGRKAPPRGAMLSGVTVRSADLQTASQRDKSLAMDILLSIDAAPLAYDRHGRMLSDAFYTFVEVWAVRGDLIYMCGTMAGFIFYSVILLADDKAYA